MNVSAAWARAAVAVSYFVVMAWLAINGQTSGFGWGLIFGGAILLGWTWIETRSLRDK